MAKSVPRVQPKIGFRAGSCAAMLDLPLSRPQMRRNDTLYPDRSMSCPPRRRRLIPRHWLDGFAIGASTLCMLHCLALPILFALLPALAGRIDPGESFHVGMLMLALPTSLFALAQGWRRRGGIAPLMTGLTGLAMMAAGVVLAHGALGEALWTVAGSLLLAGAHIINWRRAGHG